MSPASALPDADRPSVAGVIVGLQAKKHTQGVVAIAAVPRWDGAAEFTVGGSSVRMHTATSVLAIRDALTERGDADWIVILTDLEPDVLPTGVREHLVGGRPTNLSPFPLLRQAFRASRQEFGLLDQKTESARAVLRAIGDAPPPAPAGVLTDDHLFTTLARSAFGLDLPEVTTNRVALWSMDSSLTARFDVWRRSTDDVLVDLFLTWISARLGLIGPVVETVWRTSSPAQLVPLGLVAALLSDAESASFPAPADTITKVRTRLEVELGDRTFSELQLTAWGQAAALAVTSSADPSGALALAEEAVTKLQASALAARSDLLSSALAPRIAHFATALTAAIGGPSSAEAENAWALVVAHRDARVDTADAPRNVQVGAAALRLLRRLDLPWVEPAALSEWLTAHRRDLSWVDSAINRAFVGAIDPTLAAAVDRIVTTARHHRAHLDRRFAAVVANSGTHRETGTGAPLYVEDVLDTIVKPLTAPPSGATGNLLDSDVKASPVLVVVADGMDAATSNDVVADALKRQRPQWQDCWLTDVEVPHAALAAFPTVTRFSRCSLLSGGLAEGTQDRERSGFSNWLQHNGLPATGQVLFHKADLDAVSSGHALAVDVRVAVQDTRVRPVIACVLNDIDDALDRSDPIGTSWTTSKFKHLDALLEAAASVGRTVVLLSDHGHVVERRESPTVQRGDHTSARYRSAPTVAAASLAEDEVLVEGPRVLTDDHRAVLAVDEQVRYTGLRAGYHGGAALAEAVIPVSILVNGAVPKHLELEVAEPAPPVWWDRQSAPIAPPAVVRTPSKSKPAPRPVVTEDTLFDISTVEPEPALDDAPRRRDHVHELLHSDLFGRQFKQFGRRVDREVLAQLLREAIAGNGLLPLSRAAEILGVKESRAGQAVQVIRQILNTDGVVVVSITGNELVLSTSLMFEQFGVAP